MLATLDRPVDQPLERSLDCGFDCSADRSGRRLLELAPYVEVEAPGRVPAAVYRRRRLAALLLLALVVVGLGVGLRWVAAPLGGDTAPASGGAAISAVHIVRPGDTAWSIARTLQPEGDLRPLVDAVVAANGGSAVLSVGQRLVVPTRG